MEFGSGEEGLRPQSYFFVFSFLEYVFTDIQKYEEAPLWGRGEMATLAPRRAQLVSGTSDVRCLSVPFV